VYEQVLTFNLEEPGKGMQILAINEEIKKIIKSIIYMKL
jgi:hypothetical protein